MGWWWLWLAVAAAGELSLDEAIDRAWQRAAEREVVEARVRVAQSARVVAGEPEFRPSVVDLGSAVYRTQARLRLRQPIAPPGSLRAARGVVDAATDAERATSEAAWREVRARTVEAFDRARLAAEDVALADEEVELTGRRVDVLERRARAGLDVHAARLDAAAERAAAGRRLARARYEAASALAELGALVGLPGEQLALRGPPLRDEVTRPLPVDEATIDGGYAARVELAAREVKRARAERVPFPEWVQADVRLQGPSVPRWRVGTSFVLPTFRWFDGRVEQAAAEVELRRSEQRLAERDATDALGVALARWRAGVDAVRAVEQEVELLRALLDDVPTTVSADETLEARVRLLGERRQLLSLLGSTLLDRRVAEALALDDDRLSE